jgi:polar amino acid transport system substrate-binding protein
VPRPAGRWLLAGLAALLAAGCGSAPGPAAVSAARPDLHAMLPAAIRSAGVLTVLTDPEFAPISYYQQGSGTGITGSDPGLIRAMAGVLGIRVSFAPLAFDGLLTGVQSGRGEVAAGGITDTTQRERAVRFVDYFRLGELFVVRAGDAARISAAPLSACGHPVAYTFGAVSAAAVPALSKQCAAAGKPAVKPIGVDGVQAAVLAVRSGRAEVALYDDIGFGALNRANDGTLQAFRIAPYPDQYWGFAVSLADRQLAAALVAALRAITADGQYAKILDQYGVGSDALASPGIDLQSSRPQG